MKLQKALLWDGTSTLVPLGPSEVHIELRHFSEIQGTISLASQDWEIAGTSADATPDDAWREELRRRGIELIV